ncbi:hypothetical protein PUNSTDRAFT_84220 [Punctularia strigosozonata HHB-11173 SS5]|uniref:uncharacterized protein n=1 Tax=Punctularia strigosozonata (strain HHB-11173) TaxID=741275 RepID=UPI0004417C56|nr:uncharacterized protein PUNSTDRAFT_84220 [Punctularia strigosozonata HHB-11173 SS5]EIN10287.1 hypothetical protein PUNSTDRAFT_84220 [Punctularia strigosozonata HHB-11173 SS5]
MHDTDAESIKASLAAADVPLSEADCRKCPDPCEEDHEWSRSFDVDRETQMLGSVKPYKRQLVISTGKADWDREVTNTTGSLAYHLYHTIPSPPHSSSSSSVPSEDHRKLPDGVFATSGPKGRTSVLNGSHHSLAHSTGAKGVPEETVLLFPEYRVVSGVPRSADGAHAFWEKVAQIEGGSKPGDATKEAGEDIRTYVLPYACVILLCSHKRRDNRCHITAGKLEDTFRHSLETRGWEVHTDLDPFIENDPDFPALESEGAVFLSNEIIEKQLRHAASTERALILKNSHIGGHKYAGNTIIYTPRGASVWYGRVTPHEVESIVEETILSGRVLAPLLRAAVNVARPGCKSIHDW